MIGAGEEDGEPEAGGDAAAEGDLAAQHLGLQHHRRGSYKQVPLEMMKVSISNVYSLHIMNRIDVRQRKFSDETQTSTRSSSASIG